jgi:glycosyltransferase involved in cell wall biosynthesis
MQTTLEPEVTEAKPVKTSPALRVYMMDLLPTVPYYTGTLCGSLNNFDDVKVTVGSPRYYLDPDFFVRQKVSRDQVLLDLALAFRKAPVALRRGFKVLEYFSNLSILALRLVWSRPDVLHVQFLPTVKMNLPFELWFLKMAHSFGIKVVYTVHNVLPQDTGDRYRAAYQSIYSLVDRLICHDQTAADRLINEFDVRRDRISIIAHGPLLNAPPVSPSEARKRLGLPADKTVVLWQGIIRPYKGIAFLLDAWKQVQLKCGKAVLVVVGNGSEEILESIRQSVKSLGLQSSVVLDFRFVSVAELNDYFAAADILTYPYKEITTSGALMTGIGQGKAIIATNQPVFRQVLQDRINARIIEYGAVDDLSEGLLELIENPDLRSRLGEQARRSYDSGPNWGDIAAQTCACYHAAVGERI